MHQTEYDSIFGREDDEIRRGQIILSTVGSGGRDGLAIRERIRKDRRQPLPVIVYAAKELSSAEEAELGKMAASH